MSGRRPTMDGMTLPAEPESVWSYPRPPAVVPSSEHVVVSYGGRVIAETRRALRVLETSHPPVYYLPRTDFVAGSLAAAPGSSWCEFKGRASYLTVVGTDGRRAERAGWTYPDPSAGFEALHDHVAVYPGAMDRCLVDGEQVRPQKGDFYGGWITSRVTSPFKGGPGTRGW